MPTSQEKKPALKVRLAQFAKEKYPNWINGGELETFSITQGYKASNGSRRCRELADDGTFERRMNGKSVEYCYLQKKVQKNPASIFKCSQCSKTAVTYLEDKPVCLDHSKKKVAPVGMF
jgi:hypothetical protein